MADFREHEPVEPQPSGHGLRQRRGFLVRSDHQGPLRNAGALQPVADGRARGQALGRGVAEQSGHIGGPVQVGIHRHHPIEVARQQPGEDLLADRLARQEGGVLAHVGQVGSHQHQPLGAQPPPGLGRQDQFHDPGVGMAGAAIDQHRIGRLGNRRQHLAVREAMAADDAQSHAQGVGEAARGGLSFAEGVHHDAHGARSPMT